MQQKDEGSSPMTDTENAEAAELLGVLNSIPASDPAYGKWWATGEGQWLYRQITERIGLPLIVSSKRKFGVSYAPEDVANTAVAILRTEETLPYILAAADPWGYLASVLRRQLRRDAGAFFRADLDSEAAQCLSYTIDDGSSTKMSEGVERTLARLQPLVDPSRHAGLREAVWYFAERGHGRLSHLYTDAAKDPELTGLGLCHREILAIANAVLGSRPVHSHNSLLAGYLNSPGFDPGSSIPHRIALKKFSARMNSLPTALTAAA
jgi:hypothetical protein